MSATAPKPIDFSNTRTAFAYLTDADLRRSERIFRLMNNPSLVRVGSRLGMQAVRLGLPFAERTALATLYRQFVGGQTLLEVEETVRRLDDYGVATILDYGVEGKNSEGSFNQTMRELLRTLEFATHQPAIIATTVKLTGLGPVELLAKYGTDTPLTDAEQAQLAALRKRFDSLCHAARNSGTRLLVDAEESWLQALIDELTLTGMKRYNQKRAIVYNTYQCYLKRTGKQLRHHHEICRAAGVKLGVKLVRGAYMDKERARAAANGYEDPINPSKGATDQLYNELLCYCLDNLDTIEIIVATHNQSSNELLVESMAARSIAPDNPAVITSQLYGMGDNLTFNLASFGYNASKYVPYGPVKEVLPYLVRRAEENTSVTGEASRELRLIREELQRRSAGA